LREYSTGSMKRYFDKNNSRFNGQPTGNWCKEFWTDA
jgi:hypothetical protein